MATGPPPTVELVLSELKRHSFRLKPRRLLKGIRVRNNHGSIMMKIVKFKDSLNFKLPANKFN